jgi:hypothetical protein
VPIVPTPDDPTVNLVDVPPDEAIPSRRADLRRAAHALRALSARIVAADLRDEDAARLRDRLVDAAAFAAGAPPAPAVDDDLRHSEGHPWVGPANPIAPPMRFHLEHHPAAGADGRVLVGEVTCGTQYCGAPPTVHGGVVAGLFDAVVATRGSMDGGALTAQLNVRYLAPTPVDTPLRLEAEVERVDGRKRYLRARLLVGSVTCAEAEAVLVARLSPPT